MSIIFLSLFLVAGTDVSADSINAGLTPGLQKDGVSKIVDAHGHIKRAGKPWKVARIWTVAELTAKFGEPTDRKSDPHSSRMLDKTGKITRYPTEIWMWDKDDGTVVAEFAMRGYGSSDGKPETMRLQIFHVKFDRK